MRRTFAIALLLAIATPALAQDAKSIAEKGSAQWLEAYNKGDAAALTALYTSDAALMPDSVAKPIIGEAAIRKFFDGWLQQRLSNGSILLVEARPIDASHIWATGTWSGDIPGQNGGPATHVGGTWLNVVTLQGNDWKLSADTWNMMPPPPAKEAAK